MKCKATETRSKISGKCVKRCTPGQVRSKKNNRCVTRKSPARHKTTATRKSPARRTRKSPARRSVSNAKLQKSNKWHYNTPATQAARKVDFKEGDSDLMNWWNHVLASGGRRASASNLRRSYLAWKKHGRPEERDDALVGRMMLIFQ